MINEQHIVEKVSVDVNVASMELAEKIKSEINDFINNEVLSIVESYFDELSLSPELEGKVIQLDRVDLSVDTTSWNVNSNELKEEIRSEVERKMDPILKRAEEKNLLLKEQSIENEKFIDQDLQVFEKEERILKSLFYFLDHGTLPWWLGSLDESRELFADKTLLKAVRNNIDRVIREMEKRETTSNFSDRLTRQFSSQVIIEFISIRLSGNVGKKSAKQAIKAFEKLPSDVSKKVLSLLLQLSDTKTKSSLFESSAGGHLFVHIHEQFLGGEKSKSALELSLEATSAALRFINLASQNESSVTQLNVEFEESLIDQVSSETLTSLQATDAYKNLFSESKSTRKGQLESSTEIIPADISAEKSKELIDAADELQSDAKSNLDTEDSSAKNELLKEKQESQNTDSSIDTDKIEDSSSSESHESIDEKQKNETEELSSPDGVESDPLESSERDIPENLSENNTSEINTSQNDESEIDGSASNEQADISEEANHDKLNLKGEQIDDASNSGDATNENKGDSTEGSKERKLENKHSDATDPTEDAASTQESTDSMNSNDPTLESTEYSEKRKNEKPTDDSKKSNEVLSKALEQSNELSDKQREKRNDPMPEQLFVNNAGLVLLNPFLPALFKELKLLNDDGKLIDPELAACILHYAATGREGDFEFEMTFEKYLCGIPPSVILEKEITLNDAQKSEVTKVLNSVLEHWNALKSKSPALLQNEFLTRQGKLIVETSNHRLVIERKAFDLLLDKLPWSYSMIKFSWKKDLIFVEW